MDWPAALRLVGAVVALAASAAGGGALTSSVERRQTTECQAGYQIATQALADALARCAERCRDDAP